MQACRPLAPILGDFPPVVPLKELVTNAIPAFLDYPERSFISATSRALLFSLIRKHRFHNVAEIGTFFGGTTEVLARALWENRSGNLFTVDPYLAPASFGRTPSHIRPRRAAASARGRGLHVRSAAGLCKPRQGNGVGSAFMHNCQPA